MKGYLTNSTSVSPIAIWDSLLQEFNNLEKLTDFSDTYIPNKVSKAICSSSFPKSDIYEDEDNGLHINLAVAGIDRNRMELTFDKDYLTWTLKKEETEKDEEGKEIVKKDTKRWIQRGIKNPDTAEASFFVDQSKYDVEKTSIKFVDGILEITIPKKDSYVVKKAFEIK